VGAAIGCGLTFPLDDITGDSSGNAGGSGGDVAGGVGGESTGGSGEAGDAAAGGVGVGGAGGEGGLAGGGGQGGAPLNDGDPIQVAAGAAHTCVLTFDGSVWCWGANSFGEIGVPASGGSGGGGGAGGSAGATVNSPVQVALPDNLAATQIAVAGAGEGTSGCALEEVSLSCAVLSDQRVSCWGTGEYDGNSANFDGSPTIVASLSNAKQVAVGGNHACVVKTNDELLCWGKNTATDGEPIGQLGLNPTDYPFLAAPELVLSDVAQVSAGNGHTCAVKNDGSVVCWGCNAFSQLGLGVAVIENQFQPGVVALSGVDELAAGGRHTCARFGNEMACWGSDYTGALGIANYTVVADPTNVAVAAVKLIAAASESSGAVGTSENALSLWGRGYEGSRPPDHYYSPNATGYKEVIDFSLGDHHACFINVDRELKCWGNDDFGQVGDGDDNTTKMTPVTIVW